MTKNINEAKVLKEFDIDFDELKIELPNNRETTIIISEQLLINKDLPVDIVFKMSKNAAIYARYGNIRADLMAYQSLVNDKLDLDTKKWKSDEREKLTGKPSESLVEEKAILSHIVEYRKQKKQCYKVARALEKIKRVMRAVEIQAEMARTIASYMKKEMELTDGTPSFLKQGKDGKLSDKKDKH